MYHHAVIHGFIARVTVLALALLASTQVIGGETTMIEVDSKDPLIDTTKNPGCGLKLSSAKDKIDRNVRIAKFYLQSYIEMPTENLKYDLFTYKCFSSKATFLPGTFESAPARSKPLDPNYGSFAKKEVKAWQKGLPDVQFRPDASRIIPWENGVFMSYLDVGTTKAGEHVEWWEVAVLLIDDEGEITHYEFWTDTLDLDKAMQLVFAKSLEEFREMSKYQGAIDDKTRPVSK